MNTLGTADSDGVLNIPAAWNTSTGSGAGNIAAVSLVGGTLQGGTITNDNSSGIQGIGTVTSRVINNTRLLAGNGGGTLVVQTAANDNDWDGAANTGELSTRVGATLELRDNTLFGSPAPSPPSPAAPFSPTASLSTSTPVRRSNSPAQHISRPTPPILAAR